MHAHNREVRGRQRNAPADSYKPDPALHRPTYSKRYLYTVLAWSGGGHAWRFLVQTKMASEDFNARILQGTTQFIYAPDHLCLDKTRSVL